MTSLRRTSLAVAVTGLLGVCNGALAHESQGHSLEQDQRDERAEGLKARLAAGERVFWRDPGWRRDPIVRIKLLGINDFHGQLSPRPLAGRFAGGAAVLASYLEAAAAQAESGALIIHAGDHVGASPPNSALLQDEPSISFLNELANKHCFHLGNLSNLPPRFVAFLQPHCNVIGTLGNHEFDEGINEVLRLVYGGEHEDGPFLEPDWDGAKFTYVSSNVLWKTNGRHVFTPYTVKSLDGVRVAIIGAVLKETPTIVTPTGVAGLDFIDEAEAINDAVRDLKKLRIETVIVTIHQGTSQTSYTGPTADPPVGLQDGLILDIVEKLDDEVDVVISGHRHGFTNALVANANGKQMLLTQAFSASTAYDDIDLSISRRTGDVVEKSASIVTTWTNEGPGLTPNAEIAAIVAEADARVAPLVNRVGGTAQNAITRAESAAGESALGNLIADAQRASIPGVQFAFMNPGGIRADLNAGEITWGELFTIQPFGNDVVAMDLTGAQIDVLLEQQWVGQAPPIPKILKTSGLTYTWDPAQPNGSRVDPTKILDANGQPLNPQATYRVAVNSFMATGGDNFLVLVQGTNRVVGPVDLDALVAHVEGLPQPINPVIEGRIKHPTTTN